MANYKDVQQVIRMLRILILNNSVARTWRLLLCLEAEPAFSKLFLNDEVLSFYIILRYLSYILFIFLLLIWLWCIDNRGQQLNCDLKKAFIKIRRFEMLMYGLILASALIFRLAFLNKFDTWLLKVSLQLTLIPKSFSHLLFTVLKSPIFILTSFLILTSNWHLSALLLKRLSPNYLNKVFETFSKEAVTSTISSTTTYGVSMVNIWHMLYLHHPL